MVALTGCATAVFLRPPHYIVLHLQGEILEVTQPAAWPTDVRKGAPYDYWATLDTRVSDSAAAPGHGEYRMTAWPARFDLAIGAVRVSSDHNRGMPFTLSIFDDYAGQPDQWRLANLNFLSVPGLPGIQSVGVYVRLLAANSKAIQSSGIRMRPFPLMETADIRLNGQIVGGGEAFARGNVTLFEVYRSYGPRR